MTLEEFDMLPQDAREMIFKEAWDLYDITSRHPINAADVEMLADWHGAICAHGDGLKVYLGQLRLS